MDFWPWKSGAIHNPFFLRLNRGPSWTTCWKQINKNPLENEAGQLRSKLVPSVCWVLSCVSQEWAFPQCSTASCFSMTGQTDDTHKSWTSFCSDTLKRHTRTQRDPGQMMMNYRKHQWKVLRKTSCLHLTDQHGYLKKSLLYQTNMPRQKQIL